MATVSDWTYRDGMWLRDRASVIPEGVGWVGCVYGDRYPDDGREVGRYVTAQGAMRACDDDWLERQRLSCTFSENATRYGVIRTLAEAGRDAAAKAASRGER